VAAFVIPYRIGGKTRLGDPVVDSLGRMAKRLKTGTAG